MPSASVLEKGKMDKSFHEVKPQKRDLIAKLAEKNFLNLAEDIEMDQLLALRLVPHLSQLAMTIYQMGYTEGYQDSSFKHSLNDRL